MAPVISHSFRHILLTRVWLLLMPSLCLGEGLVLHHVRQNLLNNAQQHTNEIARFQAVSLELQQLENEPLAGASHCNKTEISPQSSPSTALSLSPPCPSRPSISSELRNLSPPNSTHSTAVIAIFDPANNLLGQSVQSSSPKTPAAPTPGCHQTEQSRACALATLLKSPGFSPSLFKRQLNREDKPQLILDGKWIIASHPVRLELGPEPPAPSELATGQPVVGQLVVALPTQPILAPFTRLSLWMLGATLTLMALATVLTIYWSRTLSRPAEQLRDRFLAVQQQLATASDHSPAASTHAQLPKQSHQWDLAPPQDSPCKIHEFQQLADAFDQLLQGLNQRSHALEQATREAYATSKLKSDFIAATSHELRTPLNAIIGHIQLIQDGYCDDAAEEQVCLHQVRQAALHLLTVLNELLDIARIEAGQFEFEQQHFDCGELLAEVLEMERSHFIHKGLTLQYQPSLNNPTEPSYWVNADRGKLKQVLLNLINNALKFTDQGSIRVSLHQMVESPESPPYNIAPSPTVILSVTDTGIGIDPRQRPQLFSPFARAKSPGQSPGQSPYEGSGLGLAISRTLVERMGGAIHLHSPGLGLGTTVELHLPLQTPPALSSQSQGQSQGQGQDHNRERTTET